MPQRLFIALLLATAICTSTAGQSAFQAKRDSLYLLWASGDTAGYYAHLKDCAVAAANTHGNIRLLESLESFIDPDPGRQDRKKSDEIRYVTMHMGSRAKSLDEYAKAEEYYLISHHHVTDPVNLDRWTWFVENELTNIYTRFGDYERAIYYGRLTEGGLRSQVKIDKNETTVGRLSRFYANRGLIYESADNWNNAIADYRRGLSLADSIHYFVGIQANAARLASLYTELDSLQLAQHSLGRADSALNELRTERSFLERSADISFTKAKWLQKAHHDHPTPETKEACLPYYRMAIEQLTEYQSQRRTRESAKYRIAYGIALMEANRMTDAADALHQAQYQLRVSEDLTTAFPAKEDLYRENTFIELYNAWSAWFDKQYAMTGDTSNLHRSVDALELARYANDLIIEQVSEDPSKLIAIRTNRRLVERELEIAYRLYQVDHNPAWLAKARELFNRSKSLLLDEKIRQSAIVADLSPVEKDSLRTWQDRLQQAESRRRESDLPDTLGFAIFDLREDIGGLLDRARLAREARPIAGDYIEYAMLADSAMAIFSLDGRREWRMLGARAEFLSLLDRFHDYIRSQGASLDTAIRRALHDFLLLPLVRDLPDALTIVPDGEIGYIPFDMLAGPDHRMLIETTRIAYAFAYASPARDDHPDRAADVICLAPVYPPSPYAREIVARGTLYALPYARMEADSIQVMYGGRALASTASADTTVMDSMGAARIFHYAGHAVADGQDAYIALRAEDTGIARLTADELAQAGRGPDLAILSACETGLGELALGEGIRSLGRSLLEAGAGATVMTLWTVRDGMTARIMIDFHKHLRKGQAIDIALRNAKLDYLATARHEARHPYFWAGIVATGDMEVLLRSDAK